MFRSLNINDLALSPDGRRLVLADSDVAITIPLESVGVPADPAGLLRQAQDAAGLRLEGFHLVPLE